MNLLFLTMITPRENEEREKRVLEEWKLGQKEKWRRRRACPLAFLFGHSWVYPNGKDEKDSTSRTCSSCGLKQRYLETNRNMHTKYADWFDED